MNHEQPVVGYFASAPFVIAASALPEAPPPAAPAAVSKKTMKKGAAASAEPAPHADKPVTHQPATEPKAADDDLRKFLDDRR